jgi:predicted O-methyltransferase YrrM
LDHSAYPAKLRGPGAAIRANGGGIVIGSELEPSKAARARDHLEAAGLADLVDLREGDALETLAVPAARAQCPCDARESGNR